jgi:hypothetical protein
MSAWVLQAARNAPSRWVKGDDPAVAEVAGQQVIAERAEPGESQGQAPADTKRSWACSPQATSSGAPRTPGAGWLR